MSKKLLCVLLVGIMILSGCSNPEQKAGSDIDSTIGTTDNEISTVSETPQEEVSQEEGKSQDNNKSYISLVLYFQDKDGNVIPVSKKIVKQEGIARATVNALIDDSIKREEMEYYGLYPVLPEGTEILGLNIKEGTAIIDFNSKLLDYSNKAAERSIITSLVYTLTQFGTVDRVRILINGESQEVLRYGTDISEPLSRDNVLINCENVNIKTGSKKVDGYFLKSVDTGYVYALPVSTVIEGEEPDIPTEIISFLSSDDGGESFFSEIPQGVELLDSSIENGVLTLDFSSEFLNDTGSVNGDGILKQLMYSMKQVEGVNKLKILVNGEEIETAEGIDISGELALPASINDVMD